MHHHVLAFWFEEIDPRQWWVADPDFDQLIAGRFLDLLQSAMKGELYHWRSEPKGRLAEIIVLDQFSRNVFRNMTTAFSQDPMALALSQEAVASGVLASLQPMECAFLLMPYMHSESPLIHTEAEKLYKAWAPDSNYQFELQHKAIIDRFGRYPHRNEILDRTSTQEELLFLQQPDSHF